MDEKAIFKICKDEGCCDACCLRYLGLKHPRVYENVTESAKKYADGPPLDTEASRTAPSEPAEQDEGSHGTAANKPVETGADSNGVAEDSSDQEPGAKRRRDAPCASCLGLLQGTTRPDSLRMAQETLERKRYDVTEFAVALSAPLATLLREKYMLLTLTERCPEYNAGAATSLKEAWKWTVGAALGARVGLALQSGAAAALLVTLHYEYPHDAQELEILKASSPDLFTTRRRPAVDVTRRGAELALERTTLGALRALQPPAAPARCVAVAAARAPLYVAGRYLKLSRELPQTPWLLRGERVMASSVQEIIFKPIAELYGLSPEESEHRLKFVAAGREDVDVRCLGDGRPFAVEIADPRRSLSAAELADACERVTAGGLVAVRLMRHVTKEDLALLKKGEETKSKDYEALCIKLEHSEFDQPVDPADPVVVTAADLARINAYRNTPPGDDARIRIVQKTPIRVLHRRPLLARDKQILALEARAVEGHPALFVLRLRAAAGTYIKEWAHGELRRSRPALSSALGAAVDLLALDVTAVCLPWPPA